MRENFWEDLISYLDAEAKKEETRVRREAKRVEGVRKILEAKARQVVAYYEQVCKERTPEALSKLTQVIIPWWYEEIIGSGFAEHVAAWMTKRNYGRLTITEPYLVFWPLKLQQELRNSSDEKPFKWTADFLVGDGDSDLTIEERIEKKVIEMEKSQQPADMQLGLDYSTVKLEFYHARGFRGCGFMPERYTISIPINRVEPALPKINPTVIIDFANQIENGQVRAVIERTLGSRHSR